MKRYSEEKKSMWLQDWRESGKSAWAYAKENGLNTQTLINWTKKERVTDPYFVEVSLPVAKPPPQTANSLEIRIEKGDVKIHIPLCIGCNELRSIMEGLGGVL